MPVLHSKTKTLKTYGKRSYRTVSVNDWDVDEVEIISRPPSPLTKKNDEARAARKAPLAQIRAKRSTLTAGGTENKENDAPDFRNAPKTQKRKPESESQRTLRNPSADSGASSDSVIVVPRRKAGKAKLRQPTVISLLSPSPSPPVRSKRLSTSPSVAFIGSRLAPREKANKKSVFVNVSIPPRPTTYRTKPLRLNPAVGPSKPASASHATQHPRSFKIWGEQRSTQIQQGRTPGISNTNCRPLQSTPVGCPVAGQDEETDWKDEAMDDAPPVVSQQPKATVRQTRPDYRSLSPTPSSDDESSLPDHDVNQTPLRRGLDSPTPSPNNSVLPDLSIVSSPSHHVSRPPPEATPYPCPRQLLPLLETCGQPHLYAFTPLVQSPSYFYPAVASLSPQDWQSFDLGGTWKKIGEATFSEVYRWRPAHGAGGGKDDVVLKVIPLKGVGPVTRAHRKETGGWEGEEEEKPLETGLDEIGREVALGRLLTQKEGFVDFRGAFVVTGSYPEELLSEWDKWKRRNPIKAENPRPSVFGERQTYCCLLLAHAGVDLEGVKLHSWIEAASIIWQVSRALGKAEDECQFEHRDLHWGNILVQKFDDDDLELAIANINLSTADGPDSSYIPELSPLAPAISRVKATIIDFTLSRATVGDQGTAHGLQIWSHLDDDLFESEGDYQFDIYRMAKKVTKGQWHGFFTETNVLWLHYLVRKLLEEKHIRRPKSHLPSPGPNLAGRGKHRRSVAFGTPARRVSGVGLVFDAADFLREKQCFEALERLETTLALVVTKLVGLKGKRSAAGERVRSAKDVAVLFDSIINAV